jgi:hypothetical protein
MPDDERNTKSKVTETSVKKGRIVEKRYSMEVNHHDLEQIKRGLKKTTQKKDK